MKHKPVEQSRLYGIEGGKLVRKRKSCPRCGHGVWMAEHPGKKTRYHCGKCGLTLWE